MFILANEKGVQDIVDLSKIYLIVEVFAQNPFSQFEFFDSPVVEDINLKEVAILNE